MLKKTLWLVVLPVFTLSLQAKTNVTSTVPADSSHTIDIDEVVVVASPKENGNLRQSPGSVSLFSKKSMERAGIKSMNDISGYAPNFFMPSYGSEQTSAIYIRGIGSRINTPAVGLYVDNIPVTDKSLYNTHLYGVERIDVLRGPQGTLYGRNAMGGIVRIYTENPFAKQGTEIQTGISSRDSKTYVSVLTNQKLSDKLAFSVAGFYQYSNGIFRNDTIGKKVGGGNEFGGRARLIYKPSNLWKFDWAANYEHADQNCYPYFYAGTVSGTETMPQVKNAITANRESDYRRNLFSTGLLSEYQAPWFTVSSITSYQNLGDRILMDQDFLYKDYYTLEQKQKSNAITEEIALKSLSGRRWEWTGGLFGLWQNLRTQAPVTFYGDGVGMLNGILSQVLPSITYTNPYSGTPLTISQSLALTDASFPINGYFRTPVLNGALFFQGTLHDLFVPRLSFTAGLRLDYEHQQMSYVGGGNQINYLYSMKMIQPAALNVTPYEKGKIQNDYTRLLPKFALKYEFKNLSNVYVSVSEGHRSGGYNVQMFSDVMTTVMQNDMISTTKNYCDNLLQNLADQARTETLKQMFLGIKQTMDNNIPATSSPDIRSMVTYKPEYCWDYEAGTHLNFPKCALKADLSVFYIDTHNQQISRFVGSGMGRIMVNAGDSRSCGIEMTLRNNFFDDRLAVAVNYGYTHATFHRYDAGSGKDYSGNKVPFIPEHNMGLMADYTQPLSNCALHSITLGANANGFGRIYWTEQNNTYQNFYAALGAHVMFDFGLVSVNLWGKNLTETNYKTFYFESMNRGFYERGNPMQVGVDLKVNL